MPTARVELPDGRIGRFDVPEGTTPEQVMSFARQNLSQFSEKPVQAQTQTERPGLFTSMLAAAVQQPVDFSRELGLGARAIFQSAAFLPTILPDLATLGINKALGTDIQPLSSVVSEGLTAFGFPEPQTAVERVGSDIVTGVSGGAGIAKGLQALGKKVPKIIQQLASKPTIEAVAGGGAGAASGTARELGASPLTQVGAGLFGGGLIGVAASRGVAASKAVQPATLLSDVAERGIDEPTAFSRVRTALESEAKKQRERISGKFRGGKKIKPGLFDVAKERGQNAFVDNNQIDTLSNSFKQQAIDEIDSDVKDILLSTSQSLDNLTQAGQSTLKQINELEGLRRSASRIAKSGGSKGFAGGQVLRGIDEFLENAVITGDQEAVGLWREAIKARREFGQKFEKPKKIAQAVESDQTLETIERTFLGTGVVSSQKDLARTYQQVLKAVKPKQRQEVGFALRQSALNRLIKTAAQSSDSAEGLSAARLSNSIRNLRRENKSFWDKFSKDEKRDLNKLEQELRSVSKGGVINKVFVVLEKIISRGLRSNIEVPRTLKAKTIVTVDDLLELSSFRPPATLPIAPAVIAPVTVEQQQ